MIDELATFTRLGLGLNFLICLQILIVFLLRLPVRRTMGSLATYCLWGLPLIWFLFLFLQFDLLSLVNTNISPSIGSQNPIQQDLFVTAGPDKLSESIIPQNSQQFVTANELWAATGLVWCLVAISLLIRLYWQHRRFDLWISQQGYSITHPDQIARLKQSPFGKHNTIFVPGLNTAALCGLWYCRLLLPPDFFTRYTPHQQHLVIAHEAQHYIRRDNTINLLVSIVSILNWWNPIIGMARRYFAVDQEIACDSAVLQHCSTNQRQEYARTLLQDQNHMNVYSPTLSLWQNLKHLKVRTQMICQKKKGDLSRPNKVIFYLMFIVVGGISTLTVAQQIGVQEPKSNTVFMEPITVPNRLLPLLDEPVKSKLNGLSNSKTPIPANGAYLVFIIDTSGSMHDYSWNKVKQRVNQVLSYYSEGTNFQIINDMGNFLFPMNFQQDWISNTPEDLKMATAKLDRWFARSNGSPLEGISVAIDKLRSINSTSTLDIFVFGDDLNPDLTETENSIQTIRERLAQAGNIRVHTKMFSTYLENMPTDKRETANNFAALTIELAELTGGSFELVAYQ